jgi:membrane fusion protein (multidrug efflux system)
MNPKFSPQLHPWAFAAFASMSVLLAGCQEEETPRAGFAQPVLAAEVLVRDTTNYFENIGQTRGAQDVEIRARVAGFLESINFTEGTLVQSNALLYTIDRRPFVAALAQAEGSLAQVEVAWQKAKNDINRLGPLWEKNAISRQQYDDALAAERAAAANVQAIKAAAETARIQLGYTEIRAPLEGLVGATEVKPGNLVGQGATTLLTTLSSLDPIHVRFSVSEKIYLEWRRKHGGDDDQSRRAAEGIFELILADGSVHPQRGSVVFADRQVDPTTGTLLLEVAFPNPDRIVRPGQFARVRFPIEVIPNALLVPQRAVTELQATYSVFVVGAENKAEFRKVAPGPRIGSLFVIQDGLKPGEKIVVEGIQKVQNGVPLAVTLTNLTPAVTPPTR